MENRRNLLGFMTSASLIQILAYSELSKGNVFGALLLDETASKIRLGGLASEKKCEPQDLTP